MEETKVSISKPKMSDEEVLFFSRVAEAGIVKDELATPEKYVEIINHLSGKKITSVDQVLSVIPCFVLALEEEDAKLIHKHMGVWNGQV